jgi:photosystem II stability/assembly factor-like uncharacterized protein
LLFRTIAVAIYIDEADLCLKFMFKKEGGKMGRMSLKGISRMIGMLVAIIMVTVPVAYGGWTQLKAVYGGEVAQVVIDAGGDLYCTAGGVYKSTDGGLNWVSAQGNLPTRSVGAIAAHPVNAGVLYLSTSDQGLFKTTDGCQTWTPSGAGLPAYYIRCIVISPSSPETIYVATAGDGVYKSTDGGASWAAKNLGLQKTGWCGAILPITGLAVDRYDASMVYANVHRSYFHISINGGDSWSVVMSVWGGAITVSLSNPNVLYMTNDAYWGTSFRRYPLIRSTNYGSSWHGVTPPRGPYDGVRKVTIDPTNVNVVYAPMYYGLYKSTNGCGNWSRVLNLSGIPGINHVAVDSTNSSVVYAASSAQGIHKSTDAGQNWVQASTGIANVRIPDIDVNETNPSQIYATVYQEGLLKSVDAGSTWNVVGFSGKGIGSVATDHTDPDVVFVACEGIQKSTDGGASWRRVLSHGGTRAFHPLNPGQMFASTSDWQGGIFMSIDYGESWFCPQFNYIYAGDYAFHPTDPDKIWVGYHRYWGGPVDRMGVAYSTNGGWSWSRVEFGYGSAGCLIIDPNNPSTLYAVNSSGVYAGVDYRGVWKSTNGGSSWARKTTGLPVTRLRPALVLDPTTGLLYVGTTNGVFCSEDSGESWFSISTEEELPHQIVHSLALSPDGKLLYAGTNGGIYLYGDTTPPQVTITVPQTDEALQDGVTLTAEVEDESEITEAHFYIREPGGNDGIPIGYENLSATLDTSTDEWKYDFDTTQLQDGYYVILAKAIDDFGNEGWSEVIPFSIRNWAVLELLPATKKNKAGRTMPVKFSLRIAESVDPTQPFVYNEELEIRIYDTVEPENILQISIFGDSSKDYRINSLSEHYITNFKTKKTPAEYIVEIWRLSKDFMIGSFTFKTVKKKN